MTKRTLILLASLLATTTVAFGQWSAGGRDVPDDPWRKTLKGLAGLLLFTDEPDAFFEAWKKPDSPEYKPTVSSARTACRGARVVAVVVFSGCQPNDKGDCDAEVDFKLLRPDGTVYGEHKGAELWKGKPAPPKGILQLSVGNLAFRVESDDPLGQYKLDVIVRDKVAGIEMPLVQEIEVLPAK